MKSWEFLLQKEGDRTWLPLENSTVEILEGRYRVVARTPCPQGEVDIYVSFVSSEDDPPKRRIQQRSHSANADGLLAILPFTPFRPGLWELRCRPHVEAGDVAQQWHSQIQLQVLCQEGLDDDDLFGWGQPQDDSVADSTPNAAVASEIVGSDIAGASAVEGESLVAAEASNAAPGTNTSGELSASDIDPATASDADIQRLADEMSQMVVESVIGAGVASEPSPSEPTVTGADTPAVEFEPSSAASASNLVDSDNVTAAAGTDGLAGLKDNAVSEAADSEAVASNEEPNRIDLVLEDNVLVMDGDRQITVRGQVIFPVPADSSPAAVSPAELMLTLELRDPSTKEIWASQRDGFQPSPTPQSFVSPLQVPLACRAQLLIGNATLWCVGAEGALERLLSQDFNVMAAVDALLDFARQSGAETASPLKDGTVSNLQQQAASNFLLTKFGAEPRPVKGSAQINTELLNLLKPTARSAASLNQDDAALNAVPARVVVESDRPRLELPTFGNAVPLANDAGDNDLGPPDLGMELDQDLGDELAVEPGFLGELNADGEAIAPEVVMTTPEEGSGLGAEGETALSLDDDNPFALPLDGSLTDFENGLGDRQANTVGGAVAEGLAIPPLADDLGEAPAVEPGISPLGLDSSLAGSSSLLSGRLEGRGGDLAIAEGQAIAPLDATVSSSETRDAKTAFAYEVVVDDEETLPPAKLAWMQPSPDEGKVDEDILVPAPELTVPDGVLVRGETVRIQVRVAQDPARLCARVWLLDCQSRTLMGEPQWITAFLPLGDDLMEANVDLVIPEGSIELQVEAIAVEPITQRESRKISTRRKVTFSTDGDDNKLF